MDMDATDMAMANTIKDITNSILGVSLAFDEGRAMRGYRSPPTSWWRQPPPGAVTPLLSLTQRAREN